MSGRPSTEHSHSFVHKLIPRGTQIPDSLGRIRPPDFLVPLPLQWSLSKEDGSLRRSSSSEGPSFVSSTSRTGERVEQKNPIRWLSGVIKLTIFHFLLPWTITLCDLQSVLGRLLSKSPLGSNPYRSFYKSVVPSNYSDATRVIRGTSR